MTARQFVGLALLLSPGLVMGQVPTERGRTPVRSVRERLYEPGIAMTLLRTLRQMDRPMGREHLDALADSLVAFVLTANADERDVEAVMSAVTALGLSGMQTDVGVPYGGAGGRLFQIVSGAHSAERKPSSYIAQESAALYAISQLSDRQEALTLLERSVKLDRPAAGAAVGHLDELMGAEGRATLRRLYESGQIRDRDAIERAEVAARRSGWVAPRPR